MGKDTRHDESPRQRERKPYEKPEIEKVELVPEEALLTGCKQPSTCSGSVRRPDHS